MKEELFVTARSNPLIDPGLHIWTWEVAMYLFLGGLTAGVMILTAVMRLRSGGAGLSKWARWLPFAAPIAISVGMPSIRRTKASCSLGSESSQAW